MPKSTKIDVARYRVEPGSEIDLAEHDPRSRRAFRGSRADGEKLTEKLSRRLESLQELLWAEGRHRLLLVLQALDTGGKDGTIRRVFEGTNPQGVKVASFKQPTPAELAHDYLWRVHPHVPAAGEVVIFNRSHYEDVLVVRVHELVPEAVWERRYDHINAFERLLADEGTTIVKIFLHISKDEQRRRLAARLAEPDKQWKFSRGDLAERALWDRYVVAYEAVLSRNSTPWAPWYVIPADRKWYRDLLVSQLLVDTLEGLGMSYPAAEEGLEELIIE